MISTKLPYQVNNAPLPYKGQQGGKDGFGAVLGQRVRMRQNRHEAGRGGLKKAMTPSGGGEQCIASYRQLYLR
jgi:hypothetical protein